MKIFTILLNYNGLQNTIECLESLLANTDSYNKIVIVDNSSTDNSYENLKKWISKNFIKDQHQFIDNFSSKKEYKSKRLSVLQSGFNGGFAYGNNIGINFALDFNPDYIWLLNNDTIITNKTLSSMIKAAGPKRFIGSIIYDYYKTESIWAWGGGRIRFFSGNSKHLYKPGKLDYLTFASVLIPFSAFNEIGYLDTDFFMYWEDADFCTRSVKSGYSLHVSDSAIVYHKINASSNSNKGKSIFIDKHAIIGTMRYFKKNYRKSYCIPVLIRMLKIISKRIIRFEIKSIFPLIKYFLITWKTVKIS